MKVRCIDNNCCLPWLTVGKEYEVVSNEGKYYGVVGDDNILCKYYKYRFEVVKEVENMKFKVGDWVTGTNVMDYIYNGKHQVMTYSTDKQGNKGYILDSDPFIYFDHELKLLEEPQTEFTFQEVITRIHPGEVYKTVVADKYNVKTVEAYEDGSFNITYTNKNITLVGIPSNCKFKLQVPKKQVNIYEVEHRQGGKKYYFRSSQLLQEDNFVVCGTTQGKSYGRVVGGKLLELTDNEANRYKECWRA